VPRGLVSEAVAQEPDELTGELSGVADHLLRRDTAGGRSRRQARGLLALDFLLPNAGLFERGQQHDEQIVRQGGEMGLGARGGFAVGPGFLLVELVLVDIEGLFDFPAQEVKQRDEPGPQTVFGGEEDEALAAGRVAIDDAAQVSVGV